MADIVVNARAVPAGLPQETVIKSPAEQRLFIFDLDPLLSEGEVVARVTSVKATPPGPAVSAFRALRGRYAEVRVVGGQAVNDIDAQHTIAVLFQTNKNQSLQGFVGLRVSSGRQPKPTRLYPLAR